MHKKEKTKLCGSTSDICETIIDYQNEKTEIKGAPEDTLSNRVKSAWMEYLGQLFVPFGALSLITIFVSGIFEFTIKGELLVGIFGGLITLLSLLHINKRYDYLVKKFWALKTGNRKRNRLRITEFKTKEFILYDIKNIVVDYKAKGDVAKKLDKIWIKQEHPSSLVRNQGKLGDMLYLENEPIWNAHFIFGSIPKEGYLYVEWV